MTENDIELVLMLDLMRDEGGRLKPYRDTVGKLTIGYGHNLDDLGITEEIAQLILQDDIETAMQAVHRNIDRIQEKPWQVRVALYNMAFNLGINRLLGFKKMLAAIEVDDFEEAANQSLDSKWAKQVGERAQRIAQLFRQAATE